MSTPNEKGSRFSTWTLFLTYIFIFSTKYGQQRGGYFNRIFHGLLIDMSLDLKTFFLNILAGYPLWGSSIPSHSCPYLENICLNHCPCQNSASYLNSFKNNAKLTVIKSPGSFLNKFRRISSCPPNILSLGAYCFLKSFIKP